MDHEHKKLQTLELATRLEESWLLAAVEKQLI
jgi:hypothetical protein